MRGIEKTTRPDTCEVPLALLDKATPKTAKSFQTGANAASLQLARTDRSRREAGHNGCGLVRLNVFEDRVPDANHDVG